MPSLTTLYITILQSIDIFFTLEMQEGFAKFQCIFKCQNVKFKLTRSDLEIKVVIVVGGI